MREHCLFIMLLSWCQSYSSKARQSHLEVRNENSLALESKIRNLKYVSRDTALHSACTVKLTMVNLTLDGCKPQSVTLLGCSGECKSDSSLDINTNRLYVDCQCCKSSEEKTFYVMINCPEKKKKLQSVELVSATKCSCVPCIK